MRNRISTYFPINNGLMNLISFLGYNLNCYHIQTRKLPNIYIQSNIFSYQTLVFEFLPGIFFPKSHHTQPFLESSMPDQNCLLRSKQLAFLAAFDTLCLVEFWIQEEVNLFIRILFGIIDGAKIILN